MNIFLMWLLVATKSQTPRVGCDESGSLYVDHYGTHFVIGDTLQLKNLTTSTTSKAGLPESSKKMTGFYNVKMVHETRGKIFVAGKRHAVDGLYIVDIGDTKVEPFLLFTGEIQIACISNERAWLYVQKTEQMWFVHLDLQTSTLTPWLYPELVEQAAPQMNNDPGALMSIFNVSEQQHWSNHIGLRRQLMTHQNMLVRQKFVTAVQILSAKERELILWYLQHDWHQSVALAAFFARERICQEQKDSCVPMYASVIDHEEPTLSWIAQTRLLLYDFERVLGGLSAQDKLDIIAHLAYYSQEIGIKPILPVLERLAADSDPRVRIVATQAITALLP